MTWIPVLVMTSVDQAKDLLDKLRAARKALESTGLKVARGESLAPVEYTESEVEGRYVGAWWALTMMGNDVEILLNDWLADERLEKEA